MSDKMRSFEGIKPTHFILHLHEHEHKREMKLRHGFEYIRTC